MKTHYIIKAAADAGIKPKKGYRFVTTGKVKSGDFVRHKGKPWEFALGLINQTVKKAHSGFCDVWYITRKITGGKKKAVRKQ